MKHEITVVCTGRRAHNQKHFNTFTVEGDTVELHTYKKANRADHAGERIDGVKVVPTTFEPMDYDPRVGRDTWRWDCKVCQQQLGVRTSLRLKGVTMREWLTGLVQHAQRVADISYFRR